MDPQQNIFNMVDEMSSVLLTIQGDMFKVMDGINKLNLIITKIKQYQNNNNNINNIMNMNNQMNNIMNNMQNINMGMNNMMNMQGMNMQMPMNPMMMNNIINQNDIVDPDGLTLIFEEPGDTSKFFIKISGQKLFKEAINKFCSKKQREPERYYFLYNGQKLNPEIKISELGLQDMSKIVVVRDNIIG